MVQLIESSSRALESLLSDILDLTKLDAGRLAVESVPFDLGVLAQELHALFQASAHEKSIELQLELGLDDDAWFCGDALRLRQVLTNLLSNAVKFTREGKVTLSIGIDPGQAGSIICFEVRDTGIGFCQAEADRLFERFEQADNSTTRNFGGTGLGLAITRSLVDLMGGTISATSEVGRGATFVVRLPLEAVSRPDGTTLAGAGDAASTFVGQRVTVLLAEDHPVNRKVIELLLDPELVDLETVENGEQALVRCAESDFDLVLMDMQMPIMDGLAATRAIRALEAKQLRPRSRIIMLTANALPEHCRASEEAGADGFISNPVDARALFDIVFAAS